MAQYEDFNVGQGTDITLQLELVDTAGAKKDLNGYTATAQIRKTYASSDSDAVSFSTQIPSPATNGVVNLTLTNSQTTALKSGRYVYDVEIAFQDSADNTIIERVLEGRINITPSVTRT
jgi:hypothetical protein